MLDDGGRRSACRAVRDPVNHARMVVGDQQGAVGHDEHVDGPARDVTVLGQPAGGERLVAHRPIAVQPKPTLLRTPRAKTSMALPSGFMRVMVSCSGPGGVQTLQGAPTGT